jgi:hypothetical protein
MTWINVDSNRTNCHFVQCPIVDQSFLKRPQSMRNNAFCNFPVCPM